MRLFAVHISYRTMLTESPCNRAIHVPSLGSSRILAALFHLDRHYNGSCCGAENWYNEFVCNLLIFEMFQRELIRDYTSRCFHFGQRKDRTGRGERS